MPSQLSSDELPLLQPVLASLAQLIADGLTVDARQIEKLLRATDLDPSAARVQELTRAVEILSEACQSPDTNSRKLATASLRLRGWLEAPARSAVFIAAGSPAEPPRPPGSGALKVVRERLEWTLPAGQVANAQLQITGGPGTASCDSDQITVTPAQFGSGASAIQVIVRPLAGSSLLWGNITVSNETDTLHVPIVAQWESKAGVACAAPQNAQSQLTGVPTAARPAVGQVQERAALKAQVAPVWVASPSTAAPVKPAGSRRLEWVVVLGVLAVMAAAIFLVNIERSWSASTAACGEFKWPRLFSN